MIQSVKRAAAILKLYSPRTQRLGITEIARKLGIHKATAQGLVQTLVAEGFLTQEQETRKYKLGFIIYELGVSLASALKINQVSVDPAHNLAIKTGFLVRLSIPDQDSAIVVLDAYPRAKPFLYPQFGLRFPLYCTSMGKVILAHWSEERLEEYCSKIEFFAFTQNTIVDKHELYKELAEVRQKGYAVNREEHFLSRSAIAAPIFDSSSGVTAAINIVADPSRLLGDNVDNFAPQVISTAMEISQYMGYYPAPLSIDRNGRINP
ncbi:MAG: IclR family transcriptional regulator [Desulfobacterales bacterium]|nr:IclR family transcriptional regulator [Desulfobacterales bacterium]